MGRIFYVSEGPSDQGYIIWCLLKVNFRDKIWCQSHQDNPILSIMHFLTITINKNTSTHNQKEKSENEIPSHFVRI